MTSGPRKSGAKRVVTHSESPSEQEVQSEMIANRRMMPSTRDSITHKFSISGHEGYLTIGLDDKGLPGEIFLKMSKEGSTLSGMCQAFCRAFSLALQYGLPIEDAVSRFRGMRFEPMGITSNPEVADAASIVDYVARYLETVFLTDGVAAGGHRSVD